MSAQPQLRAATRRAPLTLASLNVAGKLADSTTALAHDLVDNAVDVLALQEVKLRGVAVVDFVRRLNAAVAGHAASRRK